MSGRIYDQLKDRWERYQAKRQARLRNDFLPEAVEIVEKPTSPIGGMMILTVTGIVVFFVGWSILGRVDEVVSARGKIISVTGTQTVQAVNGGVIKEIYVKEGEHVSAGQELVVLDAVAYEITLNNTNRNIELLEYENELFRKLLAGEDIGELTGGEDSEKAELQKYVLSLQTEYEQQKRELLSEDKKADMQLAQQSETLDSIQNERAYLLKQQEILREAAENKSSAEQSVEKIELAIKQKKAEISDLQDLYDAGAITRAELDNGKNELKLLQEDYRIQEQSVLFERYDNTLQLTEIEGRLQEADSEYAVQQEAVEIAKQQREQSDSAIKAFESDFEAQIGEMIVQNQNNIMNQRAEQELQAIDVGEQCIVSPVSGIVKTLDVTTKGGVLQPAQQVASIVPDDEQMLAEIEVLNKDIGYLETNQEAAMKLDTFNFQKYGKLNGKVVSISPDALWSDQKGWVYPVKVAIDSESFRRVNTDAAIGIGMEGTMEVKVSDRAIISFFMEPIVEHFDGSLKVR
ncbi:MAG: HlyD family efflux transporter periplasmic adaptor subunit [Butyrivibrio sp.]|nr:HlyD family efflux transporter periplasmic adaptor subunit [Muribaculum sp.]MCM1553102.1 HlyD family efflux transporter periplasmic adaptor subunit [Butyrivibrio sp.]